VPALVGAVWPLENIGEIQGGGTLRGIKLAGGAALATLGLLGLGAAPAFATAQTSDATGVTMDIGPSPVGLPPSCTFPNGDANFVFLSGHQVEHDSTNKNGDWGGQTLTGIAQFYEGSTLIDTGHLTIWDGGGGNVKGQDEGGQTLNFVGSVVTIHATFHGTTSASGNTVGNVQNIQVTCS
jgi:hypothetical protein